MIIYVILELRVRVPLLEQPVTKKKKGVNSSEFSLGKENER